MTQLAEVLNHSEAYRNIVGGHGENLTQQQVFDLRTEALYL